MMLSSRSILRIAETARPGMSRTMTTAFESMQVHMAKMRMTHSFDPIPYDAKLPMTPINEDTSSKLQHKKVTIVGDRKSVV